MYGGRVSDKNIDRGGLEMVGRSDCGFINDEDNSPCDNRGFSGFFAYRKIVKMEKETCHLCDQQPGPSRVRAE